MVKTILKYILEFMIRVVGAYSHMHHFHPKCMCSRDLGSKKFSENCPTLKISFGCELVQLRQMLLCFYDEKTQEYSTNQVDWNVYTDENKFDNSYWLVTHFLDIPLLENIIAYFK